MRMSSWVKLARAADWVDVLTFEVLSRARETIHTVVVKPNRRLVAARVQSTDGATRHSAAERATTSAPIDLSFAGGSLNLRFAA
jgi:hypothetical protein